MEQCYVYKWTHLPTLRWYVGSRTKKNCHPHDGYICSSKIVKPLIIKNPQEWAREIIAIGSANDMRELETAILQTLDAKNDPRSYNRYNNTFKYYDKTGTKESEYTKLRKSIAHTGKKRPEHSKALRGRKGHWNGKQRPDMIGQNNPAAKRYLIIPPNGESYEIFGLKDHARKNNWPHTYWDIAHGKYIPKKGILKGYNIIPL